MTQTVLILGASGKIGRNSARAFADAGWTVRRYVRGTDMVAAAAGADVIVNGLNPPAYHAWATEIPRITAQVIAATRASGATVIVPGNVYNFGLHPGVLDEATPQRPNTVKGRIRKEMEAAYRASGVRTIVLRAGNFIDPGSDDDVIRVALLRAIGKGRVTALGDPDALQAYAYVPDWARAAVMLAERRATLAPFEDVPFPGHAFTLNTLREELSRLGGRPLDVTRFPWWLMTVLSPVWELAREMREMRYLWSMPHSLSDARFRALLPEFEPTPLERVLREVLGQDVDPDEAVRPGQEPVLAQ